jgi:hypothetical protein
MKVGKDDYDPFSVYELAETCMFTLGGPRHPLHRCRIVVRILGISATLSSRASPCNRQCRSA